MRDRRTEHAAFSHGAASRGVEDTVALGQLDVRQMLLVIAGEQRRALRVDGDEVQPVTGLGMLGRSERIGARRTYRRRGQPLGQ